MNRTIKVIVSAVVAAAVVLTSVSIQPATAATSNKRPASASQSGLAYDIDVSAVRRRSYRRGDRAAAGAFLGIVGTIAGIAAAEHYRRHYYDYGYGYGPYYAYRPYPYYAQPYYYPGRNYYRPRYYW